MAMPFKCAAAMMDSKQIKPSKQFSMPSRRRQVSACLLSEFVNTHLRPGNACAREVLPMEGGQASVDDNCESPWDSAHCSEPSSEAEFCTFYMGGLIQ